MQQTYQAVPILKYIEIYNEIQLYGHETKGKLPFNHLFQAFRCWDLLPHHQLPQQHGLSIKTKTRKSLSPKQNQDLTFPVTTLGLHLDQNQSKTGSSAYQRQLRILIWIHAKLEASGHGGPTAILSHDDWGAQQSVRQHGTRRNRHQVRTGRGKTSHVWQDIYACLWWSLLYVWLLWPHHSCCWAEAGFTIAAKAILSFKVCQTGQPLCETCLEFIDILTVHHFQWWGSIMFWSITGVMCPVLSVLITV